jgi:hypothetical protein
VALAGAFLTMALDPYKMPREFITVIVAAGLLIFGNKPWSTGETFDAAEKFVAEAERRYGKMNP